MMTNPFAFLCLLFFTLLSSRVVEPHGRLVEPPSRSSMWRFGFNSPANYNDHELYCGGFSRQWKTNGGKCGICGDPWDSNLPRDNEAGGTYGRGIITRKYAKGENIKVRVQLTANHMGYFEFRICPNNNKKKAASQKCLDQYVLHKSNGIGTKYYPGPGARTFEVKYRLPEGLTCSQCVFQWRYVAGNNWGTCENGTGAVGCGPQEEFRACSDISITESDGTADNTANDIFDPIKYVPTTTTTVSTTQSTSTISFVDTNDLDEDVSYEDKFSGEVQVESILLITLASIIFTGIFFCLLFLYYLKLKGYVEKFNKNEEISAEESGIGGESGARSVKYGFHWIKNLKLFSPQNKIPEDSGKPKKKKVTISSELPRVYASSEDDLEEDSLQTNGNPIPPPRVKKSNPVNTRLATINSRGSFNRPSAPPPVIPPASPPVLQIGSPTSVTINGVSVMKTVPKDDSGGVIAQARFAVANEDIPDSSVETLSLPPPLPTSEPPPLDED